MKRGKRVLSDIGKQIRLGFDFSFREPANFAALYFMTNGIIGRTGEIHMIHMLVRMAFVEKVAVQVTRRDQFASVIRRREISRYGSDERHVEPRLLFCFAERSLIRVFVELDMAAWREPYIELFMPMQKHRVLIDDIHARREIYLFVDMCHIR